MRACVTSFQLPCHVAQLRGGGAIDHPVLEHLVQSWARLAAACTLLGNDSDERWQEEGAHAGDGKAAQ
jgi:hypothetical protein